MSKNAAVSSLPQYDDRFIETAAGWYALVRENSDLGPFISRFEAEQALERHLRLYRGVNHRPRGEAFHGIGVHDTASCRKANCGRCIEARALNHGLLAVY
ncbi:DUF6316 family protein [Marinobacter sp. SS21]|uniref:DUF6316 family protein n=1 Tax=Marinobacter sp. SS21 TaxID=2979460 RepID=UPI00232C2F1C|nr:DUF6316 family protein [Marinobacter sp. SS21]MDC0664145.1 DUF6316 family protein [Marinobacter sp. SS21]